MSTHRRLKRRRHGHPMRNILLVVVIVAGFAVVGAGAVAANYVVGVLHDTPNITQIKPKPQGSISTVYAGDGTRLGFISSDVLRRQASGKSIARAVKRATVDIEDRRFYKHGGVDYLGVLRAAVKNLSTEQAQQGGSTLTMQLVRNLYTPRVRFTKTLRRKIAEAKLADQLDKDHSKRWILDEYLNNVPYGTVGGQTAVGIGAAARVFFDTTPKDLTLRQAALLAGLPQAPSAYNPFANPKAALARRNEVLRAMVRAGHISAARAAAVSERPLGLHHNTYYQQRRENFFFDYVKQQLVDHYGAKAVQRGGMKVYTTINLRLQNLARKAIADHLNQPGQPSAALVTIDPSNGHILAMASSAAYGKTVFNYATQAFRQPGSTFKGIDLMAAVRMGISPSTTYTSRELFPGWDPVAPSWHVETDDHRYHGRISLAEAIALSDNTVYAQLGADITPERIRQAAYDMGVTSHLDAYPAEAIGGLTRGVSPLEMANAYATIADGGVRNQATAIERVVMADGHVDHPGSNHRKRTFTDGEAQEVTHALEGVLTHGTAAGMGIGCPAAGKTGTTSSFTDAWFVGYTPHLSTAVWVGYPKETTSMTAVPGYGEVFGATIPAPIWQEYMLSAHGTNCDPFPPAKTPFVPHPFSGTYEAGRGTVGNPSATGTTIAPGVTATPTP